MCKDFAGIFFPVHEKRILISNRFSAWENWNGQNYARDKIEDGAARPGVGGYSTEHMAERLFVNTEIVSKNHKFW